MLGWHSEHFTHLRSRYCLMPGWPAIPPPSLDCVSGFLRLLYLLLLLFRCSLLPNRQVIRESHNRPVTKTLTRTVFTEGVEPLQSCYSFPNCLGGKLRRNCCTCFWAALPWPADSGLRLQPVSTSCKQLTLAGLKLVVREPYWYKSMIKGVRFSY